MDTISIRLVDAFTQVPHNGNPAGVVADASKLTERQMQMIARELNLSETAFVLQPTKSDADVRIRWFTPTMEVPLCGHATIASFHVLAEESRLGMKKPGSYNFRLETASGILPLEVTKSSDEINIMFGLGLPLMERGNQYRIETVRLLDISLKDLDTSFPIVRNDTLFVPVRRLHTLFSMKPDFLTIDRFLSTRGLQGLCVFSSETVDRDSAVHSRYFAPNSGINEDPVTGSAHGTLAVLLYESGLLKATDGRWMFQGEQGDAIGRRGRVHVEIDVEDRKPTAVKVGGNAVTVLKGDLLLSDQM
jgi:trans-2,3-dihydro-3-hydroxyanthranilate isomerase